MNAVIKWFIDNPIAANLLMLAMLAGGVLGFGAVKKETFPTYENNVVTVTMVYPGAASSEVEQQIVVRIEEAIADLPGIFQITSESRQGFGMVRVAVLEGFDVRELLSDVKGRVDAINTFPSSAERPIIRQEIYREFLMWIALYGDIAAKELKRLAFQIRDEMALLDGVSEVRLIGVKNDELSIEVAEDNLRKYNLSFAEIATAVRESSLNVPAGAIRSKDGDIQIQTRSQAFNQEDFAEIVVRGTDRGGQLKLADVAHIHDAFEEQYVMFEMNGKPGINMEVKMSDDPKLFEGTHAARAYIENLQPLLPDGVELKINFEAKGVFDSRFNLLKDNAISGLILVFIILMLFLRPLLAFWVVAGIATTFAGAIWFLPMFDVSINMLSMFAFIMVLGIVVDDAIIIGESVYSQQQRGVRGREAAASGAQMVLKPVLLAVLSTIIFFLPMIDVPARVLIYTRSLFFVVFLCLVFSLLESLLILPSHLSHMRPEQPSRFKWLRDFSRVRGLFADALENFIQRIYLPNLKRVLQRCGSTYLAFFFMFAIAIALYGAGWVKTRFFPNVPLPQVIVNVDFAEGTPFNRSLAVSEHIMEQVAVLEADPELLAANGGRPFIREVNRALNGPSTTVFIGLTPDEQRDIGSTAIANRLRDLVGPLPEAQNYSLNSGLGGDDPEINLNLTMIDNRREPQQRAIDAITETLAGYPGVFNVRSDLESERTEVEVTLKPYAETLGLTMADVATQIRQGFYGEELQRIPRGKEDVRVMLRYVADERGTLDTLDRIRIRTRDGREVPLATVAEAKLVPGPSTIRRVDRRRNIAITAEVEEGEDAQAITDAFLTAHLPQLQKRFTGLQLSRDGGLRTQAEFGDNFAGNFLKVFILVMALFAITFRSMFQPLLIMLAIPFGFVGALLGHLLCGVTISIFSMFGFLACSGVVVNDNLVLIERINELRKHGLDALDAVTNAAVDRFRPIVLTSITTFVGLLPILFERSLQAQFLKPMVISLAFGVLFSSLVTLFLVPVAYVGSARLGGRIGDMLKHRNASAKPLADSGETGV